MNPSSEPLTQDEIRRTLIHYLAMFDYVQCHHTQTERMLAWNLLTLLHAVESHKDLRKALNIPPAESKK